jgi:hypothetical protein
MKRWRHLGEVVAFGEEINERPLDRSDAFFELAEMSAILCKRQQPHTRSLPGTGKGALCPLCENLVEHHGKCRGRRHRSRVTER